MKGAQGAVVMPKSPLHRPGLCGVGGWRAAARVADFGGACLPCAGGGSGAGGAAGAKAPLRSCPR